MTRSHDGLDWKIFLCSHGPLPSSIATHYSAPPTVCTGRKGHRQRSIAVAACRAERSDHKAASEALRHRAARTQRCPSCSRRALGRCPHRQRSRAYCFRSTYKLLMAGITVTSPPPPSYTLASATAADDSSRPPPPPRLRSDSPLRLPPLILLIVSCGQMFNEMPLRRRCIWLMVLLVFVCLRLQMAAPADAAGGSSDAFEVIRVHQVWPLAFLVGFGYFLCVMTRGQ